MTHSPTHLSNPTRARRIRDGALTIGAVLGSVAIITTFLALVFDITTLVFRSGSMEPTIGPGAIAVARTVPATELQTGDVVSVVDDQGNRVTHRIVGVTATAGNTALITLKGDANPEPDARPYGVVSAERVLFHVDGLGYGVAWLGTPPGLLLVGAGAAALVWVAIRPNGRHAPGTGASRRNPARFGPKPTSIAPIVVGLSVATTAGFGLVHIPGTGAVFTDAATARSGAFSSKPEFVPKVPGTVACTGRLILNEPDPVALSWQHLGSPYQYRIILRDLDGRVWRTWDVTDITAAKGGTISYDIFGIGLPARSTIWQYNAEVHTMLPGGAVSAAWTGRLVSQPRGGTAVGGEDLNCSPFGEREGTPAYVAPPASLACATIGSGSSARATLTWPHLGAGYTYHVSVRNPATGNIAFTTTVTSVPTSSGAAVSQTVALTNLDMASISANTGVAEVRSIQSGAYSTGFVAYRLDISSSTGVTCSTPAPGARSLPAGTTAPTTDESSTPTSTLDPTATSTIPGPTPSLESVTPTPSESPSPSRDEPLTSPVVSSTGNYTAQLVGTESGPAAVITSATGTEVYRTNASSGDSLRWVTGTDELRIEGPSGNWSVDNASGTWTKTAVVDPAPAPVPPPASPEPPPAVEESPPPVVEEPAPAEEVVPQSVEEAPGA